jgi:hypothetical protein
MRFSLGHATDPLKVKTISNIDAKKFTNELSGYHSQIDRSEEKFEVTPMHFHLLLYIPLGSGGRALAIESPYRFVF